MNSVGPSGQQHRMPVFIAQIDSMSEQVTQGQWKGKEDVLADKVLHLFRSNVDLFSESKANDLKNERFTATVIHLVDTLNGLEIKTNKVAKAIEKLCNILQDECGTPGSIDDLRSLPSDTLEEIQSSLNELRGLIKENLPGAKSAIASWIQFAEIPLSKLNLSKEELLELAPHFTYLNINIENLKESEIHDLISKCTNLKKLVLATDQIKTTPPLPDGLKSFNCSMCSKLEEVTHLNEGLLLFQSMSCESLEKMPKTLPKSLMNFNCGDCKRLHNFPQLNDGLKVFDCSSGAVTQLPPLPDSLEKLVMHDCTQIESLPKKLPEKLKELNINRSGVRTLPDTFPAGLKWFALSWCDIKLPDDFASKLPKDALLIK